MFQDLLTSYNNLSKDEKTSVPDMNEHMIHCQGFDFNDPSELRLFDFLRFMREKDRWSIPYDDMIEHSDRGNSHQRQLSQYRNMLKKHKFIRQHILDYSASLSRDEIIQITNL